MEVAVPKGVQPLHVTLGLTNEELFEMYYTMVLARTLDERLWMLNRQGKVPIVASVQGHEAAQVGAVRALGHARDSVVFHYYRDVGMCLARGMSPKEIMLNHLSKAGDPLSGGRQFPPHGANLKYKVIAPSNVVGPRLPQAVGYALGCRMLGDPTVVLASFGDGGSSQGDAHEAMNFASIYKLPVIFFCENNRYAISVPQRKQMAIDRVSVRAAGYGFPGVTVDGSEILEVYRAVEEAVERAESGKGPTLVEAMVERLMPHTSDDDDRRYKSKEEIEEGKRRDPLKVFRGYLVTEGLLTDEADQTLTQKAKAEVNKATDEAEAAPYPRPETFYDHLYAA